MSGIYQKLNRKLAKRLQLFENEIAELKRSVEHLASTECSSSPNLYVEQLYLDKFEAVNNIEQIGVRELSGHLTIGTHHSPSVPNDLSNEN